MENILDKQIVDMNGRKLVRVNDVRLATLPAEPLPLLLISGLKDFYEGSE